jgi:hypothetical protein
MNNTLNHKPDALLNGNKQMRKIERADYSFRAEVWDPISPEAKDFVAKLLKVV